MPRKQFTAAIPVKLRTRAMKVLKKSPYTTINGFLVGAFIREIERIERR